MTKERIAEIKKLYPRYFSIFTDYDKNDYLLIKPVSTLPNNTLHDVRHALINLCCFGQTTEPEWYEQWKRES